MQCNILGGSGAAIQQAQELAHRATVCNDDSWGAVTTSNRIAAWLPPKTLVPQVTCPVVGASRITEQSAHGKVELFDSLRRRGVARNETWSRSAAFPNTGDARATQAVVLRDSRSLATRLAAWRPAPTRSVCSHFQITSRAFTLTSTLRNQLRISYLS